MQESKTIKNILSCDQIFTIYYYYFNIRSNCERKESGRLQWELFNFLLKRKSERNDNPVMIINVQSFVNTREINFNKPWMAL